MIQLLKNSEFSETLWKNGKGLTTQIGIYPEDASLLANDFLWRISSAKVSVADSFSLFPNHQRLLVVWKGDGLVLNGTSLLPDSPLQFSGKENIYCEPLGKSLVVDIGIIYQKELVSADLKIVSLNSKTTIQMLTTITYLFHAGGAECQLKGIHFHEGDWLKLENEEEIMIHTDSIYPITLYKISITGI